MSFLGKSMRKGSSKMFKAARKVNTGSHVIDSISDGKPLKLIGHAGRKYATKRGGKLGKKIFKF